MGDGVENGVEGKRRLVKMMSGKSAEAGKGDGWRMARKLVGDLSSRCILYI
jgi:hypothetical protein